MSPYSSSSSAAFFSSPAPREPQRPQHGLGQQPLSPAGGVSPTCELLEGHVGLQAKPLPVLIEGLQPQLPRLLDDSNSHSQYVGVDVLPPTDLQEEKMRRSMPT